MTLGDVELDGHQGGTVTALSQPDGHRAPVSSCGIDFSSKAVQYPCTHPTPSPSSSMEDPTAIVSAKSLPSASSINSEPASRAHLSFSQALNTVHEPEVRHSYFRWPGVSDSRVECRSMFS